MKKIIIEWEIKKEEIKFECHNCWCVFISDEYLSDKSDNCPTCSSVVTYRVFV
jgi:Zn finger protein HypA/HybF involved in hydrogenase expression